MRLIIDRFEGQFAVCEKENRTTIDIECSRLPDGVKEGDVLFVYGEKISVDYEATDEIGEKIARKMKDLWD